MAQARLIIFFAIALCGLTVVALFLSMTKAPTHFIPMILGIPTLFCGVVALNPHRRVRSAQFVGLLAGMGFLMATGRLTILFSRIAADVDTSRISLGLVMVMGMLCALLLVTCVWAIRGRVRQRRGLTLPVETAVGHAIATDPIVTKQNAAAVSCAGEHTPEDPGGYLRRDGAAGIGLADSQARFH